MRQLHQIRPGAQSISVAPGLIELRVAEVRGTTQRARVKICSTLLETRVEESSD